MLIHPWDAGRDDAEWRAFVIAQGFGHLIAAGRGRDVPVVVPSQYVLGADEVLLHLARPNPVWAALEESSRCLLAVAGDWAYIPSAWKAIGDQDPALGIPTTYYAAVQLTCAAEILDDESDKLAVLRAQLATYEPELSATDPVAHRRRLDGIRALRLRIVSVAAKFKYGGNVDVAHRRAVVERLSERRGPGDSAAVTHTLRRIEQLPE